MPLTVYVSLKLVGSYKETNISFVCEGINSEGSILTRKISATIIESCRVELFSRSFLAFQIYSSTKSLLIVLVFFWNFKLLSNRCPSRKQTLHLFDICFWVFGGNNLGYMTQR